MSDDQSKNGLDRALEALKQAKQTRREAVSLRPATKAVAGKAIHEQIQNGWSDLVFFGTRKESHER